MELLAVRQARLIAFLNAEELNPEGRPIAHDFMKAFVERYAFLKVPTAQDLLDDKGILFELGKWEDVSISKVSLFDWGIAVDTVASTDASEAILRDMLDWGAKTFGLSNRPDLITRKSYLSELVIGSNLVLPRLNAGLQSLADKVTQLVSSYGNESMPHELAGFVVAFDSSLSKQLQTPFRLERLADASFSTKKYYSGAPLRTPDHIQILTELESILKT